MSATRGRVSKRSDCWRTPPELYERLDAEFHFGLDAACESHNRLAPAGLCLDFGLDGLRTSWQGLGSVWCNPPYSNVRPWLRKAVAESAGVTVCMLLPADPSVRWWANYVASKATEVRFLQGRVRFLTPEGERPKAGLAGPSAIVIFAPCGGPPRYTYMQARLSPQAPLPLD